MTGPDASANARFLHFSFTCIFPFLTFRYSLLFPFCSFTHCGYTFRIRYFTLNWARDSHKVRTDSGRHLQPYAEWPVLLHKLQQTFAVFCTVHVGSLGPQLTRHYLSPITHLHYLKGELPSQFTSILSLCTSLSVFDLGAIQHSVVCTGLRLGRTVLSCRCRYCRQ